MVSLGSLKISFLFVATVLIFFTAGLLSIALRARHSLGAYRIPWRPAFSSHLVNGVEVRKSCDRKNLDLRLFACSRRLCSRTLRHAGAYGGPLLQVGVNRKVTAD